jgi:hypothetical protein
MICARRCSNRRLSLTERKYESHLPPGWSFNTLATYVRLLYNWQVSLAPGCCAWHHSSYKMSNIQRDGRLDCQICSMGIVQIPGQFRLDGAEWSWKHVDIAHTNTYV